MIPDPDDTIAAIASARGPGCRGIIRLSGPAARQVAAAIFDPVPFHHASGRYVRRGHIRAAGLSSPVPATLILSPAPHSYTAQDTAELHLLSCPPLLDLLLTALLNAGARAAQPGEFTLRAFLAGKKDLTQAEAVLAVIEAGSNQELSEALGQLAGGVSQPLQTLRDDLLSLLADLEAGLDFTDEDIEFVGKAEVLKRVAKALAHLTLLRKQLDVRAVSDKRFRVVLVGEPNAGKSTLFNALAGLPAAIVSPLPGTTRDYLTRSINLNQLPIELIDTAGWQPSASSIDAQAQTLGLNQAKGADLLIWCVDMTAPPPEVALEFMGVPLIGVGTKLDLARSRDFPPAPSAASDSITVSAKTGEGLGQLKQKLAEMIRALQRPALAPSLSRCRHHVDAALSHLREVHNAVLFNSPMELAALDLRLALDQIGEMAGAVYTDDLLDRIFGRFCIGK